MAENVYIGRTSFSDGFSFGFERSTLLPYIVEILTKDSSVSTDQALFVANQILDIVATNPALSVGSSISAAINSVLISANQLSTTQGSSDSPSNSYIDINPQTATTKFGSTISTLREFIDIVQNPITMSVGSTTSGDKSVVYINPNVVSTTQGLSVASSASNINIDPYDVTLSYGVRLGVNVDNIDILSNNIVAVCGSTTSADLIVIEIISRDVVANKAEYRQDYSFVFDINPKSFVVKTIDHASVENDRLVNIHNFLPPAYDNGEFYEFVKQFDEYLNYNAYFYTCDDGISVRYLGMLKMIEKAAYFNSPSELQCDYLDNLGTQRGFDQFFGKSKVSELIAAYEDTSEFRRNVYRRLVSDAPLLYSNKTTEYGSKALLLEFGVRSTSYTIWENASGEQVLSRSPFMLNMDGAKTVDYIAENQGYFPTSHIIFSLNSDTPDALYPYIFELMNTTKPINVVIDSFALESNFDMNATVCGVLSDSTYTIDMEAEYSVPYDPWGPAIIVNNIAELRTALADNTAMKLIQLDSPITVDGSAPYYGITTIKGKNKLQGSQLTMSGTQDWGDWGGAINFELYFYNNIAMSGVGQLGFYGPNQIVKYKNLINNTTVPVIRYGGSSTVAITYETLSSGGITGGAGITITNAPWSV